MRPDAGRRRIGGLLLAAILCVPNAALGQLPGVTGPPWRADLLLGSLPDFGGAREEMPGLIGGWGTSPALVSEMPAAVPVQHVVPGLPPAPLADPLSDLSGGVAWEGGAPRAEMGDALGAPGSLAPPAFRRRGPVWRWLHGVFGRRQPAVGAPAAGSPYAAPSPLLREEWRFRPFSVGWFMGGVAGGTLVDDWVDQKSGYFAGYRLGWDYSRYWGSEMRFAFGWAELADSRRAIAAAGEAAALVGRRDSDRFVWDVSLLYYPWGDTTWRPYFLAGLGATRLDFTDRLGVRVAETVFEVPLGTGVKYRYNDWLALRFDVTDNIAFGKRFNTVHDLAFTGGVEIRFGGTRKAYWPWNPGRHYW